MEYFYEFQNWLNDTRFYQEVLKELPVPLNNIYFDSIFLLCVAAYLLYRFLEAIHLALYRRRMRKRWEKEHKQELARALEREKNMMYREMNVHQKEEKVNRFMDYMELLFAHRNRTAEDYEEYDEYTDDVVYEEQPSHQPPKKSKSRQPKGIGRKAFLLGMKNTSADTSKGTKYSGAGYDEVMDAYVRNVEAEQEFTTKSHQKQKEQHSRLQELNESLQVQAVEDVEFRAVDVTEDAALTKRKEKARRAEEKERKKAERLEHKRQKGAGHGRFGKKG